MGHAKNSVYNTTDFYKDVYILKLIKHKMKQSVLHYEHMKLKLTYFTQSNINLQGHRFFLIFTHPSLSNSVSNLHEKWRDMFHFLDITNDSIMDIADVTLIQDNYVHQHNLTAEEVCADRQTRIATN